ADSRIPGPGHEIFTHVERIAIHKAREAEICDRKDGDGGRGLPSGAAGAEEEQGGTHCGEVHGGAVQGVRDEAAERGQDENDIGNHEPAFWSMRSRAGHPVRIVDVTRSSGRSWYRSPR